MKRYHFHIVAIVKYISNLQKWVPRKSRIWSIKSWVQLAIAKSALTVPPKYPLFAYCSLGLEFGIQGLGFGV